MMLDRAAGSAATSTITVTVTITVGTDSSAFDRPQPECPSLL
jgi:hypothetical protein